MKSDKNIFKLFVIVFLAWAGILCGAPVTIHEAEIAANSFICSKYPAVLQTKAGIQTTSCLSIQQVQPWTTENKTIGFVAHLAPAGYVLMRADDEIPPIKIYSEHGAFTNLPPDFARVIALELMEELDGVAQIRTKGNITPKFHSQWKSMLNNTSGINILDESVASSGDNYLLSTTWDQDDPYNYYAPDASGGPGGRAYAGCVAVAMAQIIRYHRSPGKIVKDYTYTDNSGDCKGEHSIHDAGKKDYIWSEMPNAIYTFSPATCIQTISRLMYHCAVSVKMDFEADGSSACAAFDVSDAFHNCFGYRAEIYALYSDYSDSAWYQKIKANIDNYCPVFYTLDSDYGGHAVVCDGYAGGNTIHLNLGWSGTWDAWYNLDSVIAGEFTSHGAIFGINHTAPPGPGILPEPYVYINDATGSVVVEQDEAVKVNISVTANEYAGENFDWWAIALTPSGWYYLNSSRHWVSVPDLGQAHPAYQGHLVDIPYSQILSMPSLPSGDYTFYFGLDTMNGVLDSSVVYDSATVSVK